MPFGLVIGIVSRGNEGGEEVGGKRDTIGNVPDMAVFGMFKDGEHSGDQDTDVKVAGWRQGAFLPRDVGGMAV